MDLLSASLTSQALAGIGLLVLLRAIVQTSAFLYAKFLRAGKDLKKFGKWAVVTGATDGIGKAFAEELARKGLNVLLVSRTQSKLDECAKELSGKYPKLQFDTLSIDFGAFAGGTRKDPAIEVARSKLSTLDVGVLINNVGVSYEYPELYHRLDDDRAQQLVELNINSTNWMTRLVLPGMVQRERGAVVSIGSGAGTSPSPMLAGYSAAKQYVAMMTRSLAAEYAHIPGLHFQCQTPLFITSKLSKIRKPSISTPTPAAYARIAVKTIGYETEISPYWAHSLQLNFLHALPQSLQDKLLNDMHRGLNKRALKKKEAAAKQQ